MLGQIRKIIICICKVSLILSDVKQYSLTSYYSEILYACNEFKQWSNKSATIDYQGLFRGLHISRISFIDFYKNMFLSNKIINILKRYIIKVYELYSAK